jgi:hypothetical protein
MSGFHPVACASPKPSLPIFTTNSKHNATSNSRRTRLNGRQTVLSPPEMADWIQRYSAALEARDAREQIHKPYIDACT